MNDDWRNNPKLAGMDRSKLDMLQNLASQGSSKGANEMLPFLMSAAAQGKKGGLKFNADEISAIIEVLKMGKSPAEAQKLDKVVNLMKMMRYQAPTHCLLLFADSAGNLPDSVNTNCYDNKKSTFHQLSEMYSYVQ